MRLYSPQHDGFAATGGTLPRTFVADVPDTPRRDGRGDRTPAATRDNVSSVGPHTNTVHGGEISVDMNGGSRQRTFSKSVSPPTAPENYTARPGARSPSRARVWKYEVYMYTRSEGMDTFTVGNTQSSRDASQKFPKVSDRFPSGRGSSVLSDGVYRTPDCRCSVVSRPSRVVRYR